MAPEYKDYYKTLGVARGADKATVAKAYKKLAKKYHPDLNPNDKVAEEKFKDITEAYDVLKDDEKRKLYDRFGSDWEHASQFGNNSGFGDFGSASGNTRFEFNGRRMDGAGFGDFFENIFGGGSFANGFGGRSRPPKGRDVETSIRIPLETVLSGSRRSLHVSIGGKSKTLEVNIPAGVKNGSKLRLAGQGEPGAGGTGDLFVKIEFAPHDTFSVEGNDLIYEARLMPWQAVLGGKVRIPTLDGAVELNIPAGTCSGRKMRLRGKGLGKNSERGDLLVNIGIDAPSKLTDQERALWRELEHFGSNIHRSE